MTEQKRIILHARKTFLYDGENYWCKKINSDFDITMGAFDGGECCEIVGLFLLNEVANVKGICGKKILGCTEMMG